MRGQSSQGYLSHRDLIHRFLSRNAGFATTSFPGTMAVDTTCLIDSRVSVEQCETAVLALLRHVRETQQKAEEEELLPGKEPYAWLVVAVKRVQPMKNLKPQM